MSFEKGHKINTNKSNRKGIPNKVTTDIRESFKLLIEQQLPKLNETLEQVRLNDPDKYFTIISNLSEYIIPKLARTEIDSKNEHTINQPVILVQNSETADLINDYINGNNQSF